MCIMKTLSLDALNVTMFAIEWTTYRHLKLKHEDTSNTIKCDECEYTTKLKYNLDRHMDRVHNQSNK